MTEVILSADHPIVRPCRACRSWKRRDQMTGTCWLRQETVLEHETCGEFVARLLSDNAVKEIK